ncbi:MAG: triphosphoribosyl-dephospho-CoA synthase [Gemmataceae bacterium]
MTVADCIQLACEWEARTRKPGNVHPGASFADTTFDDFMRSAAAIRDPLTRGLPVGEAVLAAVQATRAAIGKNTNLGIVLLLAPLARSSALPHTLASLTLADADATFRAIRLAKPGGLGDAPDQDVAAAPTVTLLEAMMMAADRDLIARQYANGFADIFDFGVPKLAEGFSRYGTVEDAILHSQLGWLAAFPDSLIARKRGNAAAEDVRQRSEAVLASGGIGTREWFDLDRHLRSDGNALNPGTTADLIAASLFVALREGIVKPDERFASSAMSSEPTRAAV